jgi:hypothetical protein
MPDSDRTGGHLGELRDALAQMSFTLTELARQLVPVITGTIGHRIGRLTGRLNSAEQKRLTALLTKALDS